MARKMVASRRSRAEWQQLVERQRVSELPEREFCRREDLNVGTFRWWRSKLRSALVPNPGSRITGPPSFVAVTVRDATPTTTEPGAVEILVQGDERRARIRADCPVELAVAITEALRGIRSCS